jgi:predicted DNA-binding antitoxin AbrB/MazE fold protein
MHEHVEVIYENGVLRPLGPLPSQLHEHQHLTITIDTPDTLQAWLDGACVNAAKEGCRSDGQPGGSPENSGESTRQSSRSRYR